MNPSSLPEIIKEKQTLLKGGWLVSKTDEGIEILLQKILSARNLILLAMASLLFLPFTLPLVLVIPMGYFAFYFYVKGYLSTRKFMREYASSHNLQYVGTLDEESLSGRLFKRTRTEVEHVMVGEYLNFPIRIFYYSYSAQEGKHTRVYPFTVSEITIGNTKFPHLLLLNNKTDKHQNSDYFGDDKDVKVGLGRDDSSYTLYTTNNYELEALQICTPEFIELFKNELVQQSVECAENKLYIYTDKRLTKKDNLDILYATTKCVIEKSGPFLIRMKDDYEALHGVFRK